MRLSCPLTLFPTSIPGYTVLSRLGGGRYGVCYLAQRAGGTQVVLKRFRQKGDPVADHGAEAVLLSQLCHPAIPALLGICHTAAHYCFVLEYMPGRSLEDLLFRVGHAFSDQQIFRVIDQLLSALTYLHRQGVVHGDLRISNLLYDGARLSLLDFGLSRPAFSARDLAYDFPFVGEVLLYLLYSRYTGPKQGTWMTQLSLSAAQRRFLCRLLGLAEPFPCAAQVHSAFWACFSPENQR